MQNKYDFIFIDVPPTFGLANDSALYACDQLVIVLQTQERALDGAKILVIYLQSNLIDEFHSKVDILGILPVLSKRNAQVDAEILNSAIKRFSSENIFNRLIMTMECVKRMNITGITDGKTDIWAKPTHKAYINVAKEILEQLRVNERCHYLSIVMNHKKVSVHTINQVSRDEIVPKTQSVTFTRNLQVDNHITNQVAALLDLGVAENTK